MAINKIIAIGGTGIKCLESFIHYCAVSCVRAEYDVLIVEADYENGNLYRLQRTIENYVKVQSVLYHDNIEGEERLKFGFGGMFRLDINNWFKVWKPTEITGHDNTLGSTKDFIGSDLAKSLYTDDETKVSLEEGFRGHPSIGALMTGLSIDMFDKQDSTWDTFIGQGSDLTTDQKCKVFILGSLFGGTGASGIYSIANQLVNYEVDDGDVSFSYKSRIRNDQLKISLGMMTPYYNIPQKGPEKDMGIAATHILENTHYALRFYKDYPTLTEKLSIVLVGKDDRDIMRKREYDSKVKRWRSEPVEYELGGKKQTNPSLISELVMASSMWQFFNNNNPNLFINGMSYLQSRSVSGDGIINWDSLRCCEENFPANLRTTLMTFLCFMYKLYPQLNKVISKRLTNDLATKYGWLEYFRADFDNDKQKKIINEQVNCSYQYFESFIKWIHSVGNVTKPIDDQGDINDIQRLGKIIDIDLLELIRESTNYMENFDYSSLVIDHKKKGMQWNKGFGKIEVKLNDKAIPHNEASGYSLHMLFAKLYKVGGAK